MMVCFQIICVVGVILSIETYNVNQQHFNDERNQLSKSYPIVTATFNDPKVTIQCTSLNEFLTDAKMVNATVIYSTSTTIDSNFVVTDPAFMFAYNLPITASQPAAYAIIMAVLGFVIALVFSSISFLI